MKAKVIRREYSDNLLDSMRGISHTVDSLLIEDAENLLITVKDGQVYTTSGYKPVKEPTVLAEIEVPDDFVQRALAFIQTREELFSEAQELIARRK